MANFQVIINSQVYKLIPYGFCRCGCGQKTRIARASYKKSGQVKGEPLRFIRGHSLKPFQLGGKKSAVWKGGRHKNGCGYFIVQNRTHPRADQSGYVPEHIMIAEKALGKFLPPGVVIHHANGTRDSGPLVICQSVAYHELLHLRTRALKACGHAGWRKCWICKQYDEPENLYIGAKNYPVFHRQCHNERQKKRRNLTRKANP